MKHRAHSAGVTLLEVLLVLAVGGMLLVLGIKQYNFYQRGAEIAELQANADQLFFAAVKYYQAECGKDKLLDPLANPSLPDQVILNVQTDLIDGGYLDNKFPKNNRLVNDGSGYKGYYVQLNKDDSYKRTIEVCDDVDCTSTTTKEIGTIIIWHIQVGVRMKNNSSTDLNNIKNALSANCLSAASGAGVRTCAQNVSGDNIVFELLPGYAVSRSDAQSQFWMSTPIVTQFNQMYTTEPLSKLMTVDHIPEYQYYYCSG